MVEKQKFHFKRNTELLDFMEVTILLNLSFLYETIFKIFFLLNFTFVTLFAGRFIQTFAGVLS